MLERLFPIIVKGGVLILDDYGVFPGETKAVDEYFASQNIEIKKFTFCMTPCYVVK
ncbi:TylF/MycF/NovP-related O-methyltransferase [Moorena sp. SIO4E2]|uniref:TylF/MycF/NovP-related O-methyltransferase n=1 Tax=Moorena sp. SIO4E2 TaxID=2607826 RepID=UPI00338D9B90